MTVLEALIVDDELPARDELKFLLSRQAGIVVTAEADSGPAALVLAAEHQPDVVFLDVEMRGMSGVETALTLRAVVPDALIVFATAYDDYAVKAFEIGAVDYLLKPFEEERVAAAVERLQKYRADEWAAATQRVDQALAAIRAHIQKLAVERNGKIVMIDYRDILYAFMQAGAVTVVTGEGKAVYPGTLSDLQERLQATSLVRVHKSYIVNLDKVVEVIPWFKGTYWLRVGGPDGAEIPVSKGQIKEIKEILGLK
ncbi:LytR/AlgR family response regulator transcription factor [Sporolituus thermophilus]|uniref:LytR/AlgR family response regulator transcription factor n=1 Tax=Sporolituus thermophilus TaxID=608505 RepID=UPI000B83F50F|nr:LytTR family DNA-binding domain-containing protein [Sporolituus thermophilus]